MTQEVLCKTSISTFDNFTLHGGVFFTESRSSGEPVRRALALHGTQPPSRPGSQNEWHLHLVRMKEVEVEVKVETEVASS